MTTSADAMPCRELVELVTDRLEGALSPGDRARFDEHLAECDGCTTYVEQVRATIAALGRVPAPGLPADARERLRGVWATVFGTDAPGPGPSA